MFIGVQCSAYSYCSPPVQCIHSVYPVSANVSATLSLYTFHRVVASSSIVASYRRIVVDQRGEFDTRQSASLGRIHLGYSVCYLPDVASTCKQLFERLWGSCRQKKRQISWLRLFPYFSRGKIRNLCLDPVLSIISFPFLLLLVRVSKRASTASFGKIFHWFFVETRNIST